MTDCSLWLKVDIEAAGFLCSELDYVMKHYRIRYFCSHIVANFPSILESLLTKLSEKSIKFPGIFLINQLQILEKPRTKKNVRRTTCWADTLMCTVFVQSIDKKKYYYNLSKDVLKAYIYTIHLDKLEQAHDEQHTS